MAFDSFADERDIACLLMLQQMDKVGYHHQVGTTMMGLSHLS